MNLSIKMIVILLSMPFMIFIIHMIASRVFRRSSAQMIAVKSVFAGYISSGLVLWFFIFRFFSLPAETAWAFVYFFSVYTSFAYTYFHFFNMSETARRIRILNEIYKAGPLSRDEIGLLYKSSDIIRVRIQRLVAMKKLKYDDGHYSLEGKLLYFAGRIIVAWRRILRMDNTLHRE